MITDIIIAILAGMICGLATGLIPGLHINLTSLVAASLLLQLHISPLLSAISLMSLIASQAMSYFIPSTLLGAADEGTALSVLPSHRLLFAGRGYEALLMSVTGALMALGLLVMLSPVLVLVMKPLYNAFSAHTASLLIIASLLLIVRAEDNNKRFWALFLFLLSGLLGIAVLNNPLVSQPLLPLLSGLFGVEILFRALNTRQVPQQAISANFSAEPKIVLAGAVAGSLVALFPAMGPGHASSLASTVVKDSKNFILLSGATTMTSVIMGLIALFTISKARNGSIVVLSTITSITPGLFSLLLIISLVAGSISCLAVILVARALLRRIHLVNYSRLALLVLSFILLMVLLQSSVIGIAILAVGLCLSTLARQQDVQKSVLMGCLILPVILNYLY